MLGETLFIWREGNALLPTQISHCRDVGYNRSSGKMVKKAKLSTAGHDSLWILAPRCLPLDIYTFKTRFNR